MKGSLVGKVESRLNGGDVDRMRGMEAGGQRRIMAVTQCDREDCALTIIDDKDHAL